MIFICEMEFVFSWQKNVGLYHSYLIRSGSWLSHWLWTDRLILITWIWNVKETVKPLCYVLDTKRTDPCNSLDHVSLMPPHVHTNFCGPPSWLWRKCNRLLTLGRPWGAVTLSRWCEGWCIGRWGARRGHKSRSTNYPDHGHHGDPPPTRKIHMVEPGIEPGTSWLVVRSSDH